MVSIFGYNAEAEARALLKVTARRKQQPAEPMSEADRLLQTILEAGDLVGQDDAGRMVIQLAVAPRDFDRLMAFGADAAEAEDGGDDEPYACSPMSPCWFGDGGAAFFRHPADQVLDVLPPKQVGWAAQIARAVALGLLLVMVPGIDARADQAPLITKPLPMSTAEAPQQCCRDMQEGQALRRRVHQRREAVQEGTGLRVLGRWRILTFGRRAGDPYLPMGT